MLALIHAGIHFRSSNYYAILLGEQVGIGLLNDRAGSYIEPFTINITKFDGTAVIISNESAQDSFCGRRPTVAIFDHEATGRFGRSLRKSAGQVLVVKETEAGWLSLGGCVPGGSARCIGSGLGATNPPQRESAATGILLSPTAPNAWKCIEIRTARRQL